MRSFVTSQKEQRAREMKSQDSIMGFRSAIDDLAPLRAYVAVVEAGSFSEAGRRLRVVPSTVSKYVAGLEERIAGQLIARSTKRLAVTELGRRFYGRCLLILDEVREAETEIREYSAEPQGLLRITVPTVFATLHIGPILEAFAHKYPKVGLDVMATTETIDLIESSIDVGVRFSSQPDPGLIAIKLAANQRVFCAAPSYIARRGPPCSVGDLVNHDCILGRSQPHSNKWPSIEPDGTIIHVNVDGKYASNNGHLIRNALIQGFGVGYVARFIVHDDIVAGRLLELFPGRRPIMNHLYAVRPARRNIPPKTRVFLDHLKEWFRVPPDWAR